MRLKKFIPLLYIFLAFFFLAKDLAYYASRILDSTAYAFDIEEKGSTEKNEKEDNTEKEIYEKDQFCNASDIILVNGVSEAFFISHGAHIYYTPYFEIISPPPEQL